MRRLAKITTKKATALNIEAVDVNQHCDGEEWQVADFDKLAYLIALVALGQAYHAETIIRGLALKSQPLGLPALKLQAETLLTVKTDETPWRRDGFLFECISWIAARQTGNANDYMRDPHLKATTQGLDGLMLRVVGGKLKRTTIFEDKCTKDPKKLFAGQVMTAFAAYHSDKRASELLAATGELLRQAKLKPDQVAAAAALALTKQLRTYRAGLTVAPNVTDAKNRSDIFDGYDKLAGISQAQRVAAVLRVPSPLLRPWCETLAKAARDHVNAQSDLSALGITNV